MAAHHDGRRPGAVRRRTRAPGDAPDPRPRADGAAGAQRLRHASATTCTACSTARTRRTSRSARRTSTLPRRCSTEAGQEGLDDRPVRPRRHRGPARDGRRVRRAGQGRRRHGERPGARRRHLLGRGVHQAHVRHQLLGHPSVPQPGRRRQPAHRHVPRDALAARGQRLRRPSTTPRSPRPTRTSATRSSARCSRRSTTTAATSSGASTTCSTLTPTYVKGFEARPNVLNLDHFGRGMKNIWLDRRLRRTSRPTWASCKLVLRRLALGVLTLFVVSVVVFLLTQALRRPGAGGPRPRGHARQRRGFKRAARARPAAARRSTGLAQRAASPATPAVSYTNGEPIMDFLGDRIKNSLFLMFMGVGRSRSRCRSLIGAYAALRRDKAFDNANSVTSLIFAAMPEFVVGVVARGAVRHQRVAHASRPPSASARASPRGATRRGSCCPLLTLVLAVTPYVSRVMRASMIEVLESDYIEMARLKGLPERTVLWRHAAAQRDRPDVPGDRAQRRLPGRRRDRGRVAVQLPGHRPRAARRRARPRTSRSCSSWRCSSPPSTWSRNLLADIGTMLVTPRLRTRLQ